MRFYNLDSILNFGKYSGRILNDLATENAMYIEWCIINVEFFLINESTVEEIKKIYPRFLTSEKANEILNQKIEDWNDQQELEQERRSNKYSNNDNSSNWDNQYYNDGLDLDQQSPEWWDSL